MKSRQFNPYLVMIIVGLYCSSVEAAPFSGIHPLQTDRFSFNLGGYLPELDGRIWADADKFDAGTHIDMQSDLGMDDSDSLPAMGFLWRFTDHSRLQVEYFEINSSGSKSLNRDIEWGDLDFSTGVIVESDMNLGILRAFYGYSFVKDDKKEFGAGVGLHYLDSDILLRGNATVNDVPLIDAEGRLDEWAVLPNIGAYGNYALSDKWLIIGRVDWISAAIDKYDGGLWNVEGAVQYQAFKNFGFGLAYRYVALDIEVDESGVEWGADVDFSGPMLFVTTNF